MIHALGLFMSLELFAIDLLPLQCSPPSITADKRLSSWTDCVRDLLIQLSLQFSQLMPASCQ